MLVNLAKRKSGRRQRQPGMRYNRTSRLGIETLERRDLFAADVSSFDIPPLATSARDSSAIDTVELASDSGGVSRAASKLGIEIENVYYKEWAIPGLIPDLSDRAGGWFIGNNPKPRIEHADPDDRKLLRLWNEHGDSVGGVFRSTKHIEVSAWNTVGELQADKIVWDNGTVWRRERGPAPTADELAGAWAIGSSHRPRIWSGGCRPDLELTFVNEQGSASCGRFDGPHRLVADDWFGLRGTYDRGRIYWDNGRVWSQFGHDDVIKTQWPTKISVTNPTPHASIADHLHGFTNEDRMFSFGRTVGTDSTTGNPIVRADGWRLFGRLAGGAINWDNYTTWINHSEGYQWGSNGVTRAIIPADRNTDFNIDYLLPEGLRGSFFEQTLVRAINRWEQVIESDIPSAYLKHAHGATRIDDLLLTVHVGPLDGSQGTLARNEVQQFRLPTYLPIWSHITVDEADVNNARLETVLIHEIGHALGFGSIWKARGLIDLNALDGPHYTGPNATYMYSEMTGKFQASVPVENGTPNEGSHGSHWRESVFDNEVMTPGIQYDKSNPLSLLTLAAMTDLGYWVNYAAADDYRVRQGPFDYFGGEDLIPRIGSTYSAIWVGEGTDEQAASRLEVTEASLSPDTDGIRTFGTLETMETRGIVEYRGGGEFAYQPDGAFTYLADGETALDHFGYTLVHQDGSSETIAVAVEIVGKNDSPAIAPIAEQEVNVGDTLQILVAASDPDATDELAFSLDRAPVGASIDPVSGEFVWSPGMEHAGQSFDVQVHVTDNSAERANAVEAFTIDVNEYRIVWHNLSHPADVNDDGFATAIDALQIINKLNVEGAGPMPGTRQTATGEYYDVNNDGFISPADALVVINSLNRAIIASAEAPVGFRPAVSPRSGHVIGPDSSLENPPNAIKLQASGLTRSDESPQGSEAAAQVVRTLPATSSTPTRWPSCLDDELELALDELATDVATAWQAI